MLHTSFINTCPIPTGKCSSQPSKKRLLSTSDGEISSLRSVRLKRQHSFTCLPAEEGFANFCSLSCSFFKQSQKEEFAKRIFHEWKNVYPAKEKGQQHDLNIIQETKQNRKTQWIKLQRTRDYRTPVSKWDN